MNSKQILYSDRPSLGGHVLEQMMYAYADPT